MDKKYKYVNAGVTSVTDLVKRLVAGEIFWLNTSKVYFNADSSRQSPFRIDMHPMTLAWAKYAEMCIREEVQWFVDIPDEGIWCWCWDEGSHAQGIELITDYHEGIAFPFVMYSKTHVTASQYAQPLTAKELELFKQILELRNG